MIGGAVGKDNRRSVVRLILKDGIRFSKLPIPNISSTTQVACLAYLSSKFQRHRKPLCGNDLSKLIFGKSGLVHYHEA
jgi:hypothetical protein